MQPKYIGAEVQRLEDPRLLTGAGQFVDDIKLFGTLHLALCRSDVAHARLDAIHTAAAKDLPGVVGIYTAEDLPAWLRVITATSRMKNYQATPLVPLVVNTVCYVGQPVVAVVAEDRYVAEDAAALVDIEMTPLQVLSDAETAVLPTAPVLHASMASNVIVARDFIHGAPAAAMAEAAVRVSGCFRMRRKAPSPLENRSYLAAFDRGKQALTLYSSTQVPGIIRDALVQVLDMPGSKIRVVAPDVGGGFGSKTSLYPEEILVAALARQLQRPVKWTADRREDLLSTSQAFDEVVQAELGLDGAGNLLALQAEILGDVGAFSIYPWTAALEPMQVAGFMPGPYRLAHYAARVQGVATNKPPMGPYRGVGRPMAVFVMERLMDMAARKLDIDPTELRRRNLVKDDEFPYRIGSGIVWDRSGFHACLDLACAKAGYDSLRKKQQERREAGHWFGIGVASYAELTGIGSRISAAPGMPINTGTESVGIKIDASGSVTALFGIAAHGQGLETTMAQIIADELGVKISDVTIVQGDTDAVTHSTGTYASRSAVIAGGAATLSARAVRKKVVAAAAYLLEAPPETIVLQDSLIHATGSNKTLSLGELAHAVYSQMGRFPKELRRDLDLQADELYDPYVGTTTAATHVAVVDIDPDTFEIAVKCYVVAEDCGRVINPKIVDGQVHGGVAQGLGAALYEEMVYDEEGQALSASLVDYLLPSAMEVPSMAVYHLDRPAEATLGGYRGMGEGGTIGAPAAIANAIADAVAPLNIDITELPMTPEKLFQRLREKAAEIQETG